MLTIQGEKKTAAFSSASSKLALSFMGRAIPQLESCEDSVGRGGPDGIKKARGTTFQGAHTRFFLQRASEAMRADIIIIIETSAACNANRHFFAFFINMVYHVVFFTHIYKSPFYMYLHPRGMKRRTVPGVSSLRGNGGFCARSSPGVARRAGNSSSWLCTGNGECNNGA